jgi:hypothetical protein
MALIFLGEAFNRVELVLMNSFVEISGDSDIQRTGAAGEDIDPELVMESVAHAERVAQPAWVETPRIGMVV